jgi:hypothetical protein
MDEIGIEINRSYADIDGLVLGLEANNGRFYGRLDEWLCQPEDLKQIGEGLSPFPSKIPDEYIYRTELLHYLMLRAYTTSKTGDCAIEIAIKDTETQEECRFSIKAEAWAVHRFGELLKNFSTLKYSFLRWSLDPDNDLLVKN